MLRKRRCEDPEEAAVHTELTAIIAHQQVAEVAAEAERRTRQGEVPSVRRPWLRTRIGWTLVRWGTRLAPPPAVPAHRPGRARMAA
jgi:hypothetical protein